MSDLSNRQLKDIRLSERICQPDVPPGSFVIDQLAGAQFTDQGQGLVHISGQVDQLANRQQARFKEKTIRATNPEGF